MEEDRARGSYKTRTSSEFASYQREEFERVSSLSNLNYEANKLLSDYQNNYKDIVRIAHFYADKIGIIKSAIRVYVTFTAGEIKLDGGAKKNKDFLEDFIEETKLNKVVRQSTNDLYKAGNFFWYREKDAQGKTEWIHQLSPVDVNVKGHKKFRPVATWETNDDPDTLPKGLNRDSVGNLKLPLDRSYHCAIDREGYARYGKTILSATFEAVQHISELQDMEKESIENVIEYLIIFTLGDKDRPATEKQLKALSDKVKSLKNTSRLVGNHTLSANAIKPDLQVFDPSKFEMPMKQLLYSLGITPSIFTGEGSYATASVGMMSAKRTMEIARKEIIETLEDLFKDIARENGFDPKKNPSITLGNLDLNDEKLQHAIIRDLYLDGIISAETYAEVSGYLLENEQKQIEEEGKKYKIEPRQMSSTLSGEGRPESVDSKEDNNPNQDKKPSTDN